MENSGVSIDEVLAWGEELGRKAKEVFGGWHVDVSHQTFSDLRARCDLREREELGAARFLNHLPVPINGIVVHVVEGLPDGLLFPCHCTEAA